MRLLFIYFYREHATFDKGTIIHLSKKYKFSLDKEKSAENEFYFNKKENYDFLEDFYSKNIDIGILIGENGTGKSILLNAIRDKKNDYSIIVYEDNSEFYFMNHVYKSIKIKVDGVAKEAKKVNNNFEYIYYSPILDSSENDKNPDYNISNRKLLNSYDDLPLNNRLSLIENDDIHKYFNIENKELLGIKEIKEVKQFYSKTYFNEVEIKLLDTYQDKLIQLIKDVKTIENKETVLKLLAKINTNYLSTKTILDEDLLRTFFYDNLKSIIDKAESIDVEFIRLLFILSFKNYTNNLTDNIDKVNLQTALNFITSTDTDNNESEYKKFSFSVHDNVKEIIQNINSSFTNKTETGGFTIEGNYNKKDKTRTQFTTEDFFVFYKLIIKDKIKPFTYEIEPPFSSGEKTKLILFARINAAIKKIQSTKDNQNILILLDEADLKLHLEWQRKFVHDLIEFLNTYSDNKFYILYATHSPMILSDITDDRVVFLENDGQYSTDASENDKKSTFGANIYDIYNDSFL